MLSSVPRLLVFDLDGTLIDSRNDLCNSVNATLVHFGQGPLPSKVIASYIGDGANVLVRRALAHASRSAAMADAHDDVFLEQALSWFLGFYRQHMLDETYVYPGVMESLATMRAAHPELPMALLTNKPVAPSRAICRHFGFHRYCFQIYGGDSFGSKKPSPQGLLTLISEACALMGTDVPAASTVMIGDSHVDIETAKNAGARSLGCLFGLAPETRPHAGADALVESAWDWPLALGLCPPG